MATNPPGNFLQPLGSLFGMNAPQAPQTQIVPDETIQDIMKMANALRQKPDKVHGPYGALGTVIGALRGNQMAEQADAIRRGNADIKLGQQPYFGPGGSPLGRPDAGTEPAIDSGGTPKRVADASGVIPGFTGGDLAPEKRAIAGNESGGNYDAVGPQTKHGRAYGKYQVLESNVGPWTKEFLGQEMTPEEFRQNPEAQEKVFEGKFGQYKQQYGDQGAAQAWFGGPGSIGKNVNDGYHDSNWYTSNFNRGMGGGPQVASAGDQLPRGAVPASAAGGARGALPGIIAALHQGAQGAAQGGAAPPGAGEGLGQQFAASAGARGPAGPAGSSVPAVQAGGAESAGWSELPRNMWVPEQSIPHYPPASRAQLQGLILQGYSPDQVQQFALRGQTPYPIRTVPGQGQIMYDPKTRQQFWQGEQFEAKEKLGDGLEFTTKKVFNPDGTARVIGKTPQSAAPPAPGGNTPVVGANKPQSSNQPPQPQQEPPTKAIGKAALYEPGNAAEDQDTYINEAVKSEGVFGKEDKTKTEWPENLEDLSTAQKAKVAGDIKDYNEYAKVARTNGAEVYKNAGVVLDSSRKVLPQLELAKQILNEGKTHTGPVADLKAKFQNLISGFQRAAPGLADSLGITEADANQMASEAGRTEFVKKLFSGMQLGELRPFLGPGAGQFRVAEISIIQNALANKDLTDEGNLAVLNLMQWVTQKAMDEAELSQSFGSKNGYIYDSRHNKMIKAWNENHKFEGSDQWEDFKRATSLKRSDAPKSVPDGYTVGAPK